jgi:hypothetical protein
MYVAHPQHHQADPIECNGSSTLATLRIPALPQETLAERALGG